MKFDVIVADCPWPFKDTLKMSDVKRSAQAHYDVMTISDIQQLAVQDICNPGGAVLCLWVPSSLLQEGLDTMKAWGFKHKQTYIWVKTKIEPLEGMKKLLREATKLLYTMGPHDKLGQVLQTAKYAYDMAQRAFPLEYTLAFGMGRLFRQTHEICLIGTSSNAVYKQLQNKSQRSVSFGENLKHSAKPEALQDSLEIMFPTATKLEMFARRIRPGWTCLGNEIDGQDIREALDQIK
jgi:N6-adenosine-specific RNA methylase IME4